MILLSELETVLIEDFEERNNMVAMNGFGFLNGMVLAKAF